ncbi:putative protease YdeA [Sporomusa silvacetica DSM 10669]|uniref:Protease YdeA n=2 Tax=Sporomusa silvacetica TaxID=55504 RepID=A0ABZ3IN75_9FIRM|nr:putative protease YdeA [Sporomusa silvacetica DSM 10669]
MKNVYILVFNGMADWEPAIALCEIRRRGKLPVVSVGFSKEPITTMGGLKVTPDITLSKMNFEQALLVILPGGEMWQKKNPDFSEYFNKIESLERLLINFHKKGVPIAAICGATITMARAGLLKGIKHTSNAPDFLDKFVPDYGNKSDYVADFAVRDGNIITASGGGSVEFARRIIELLGIYPDNQIEEWYQMFKFGIGSFRKLPLLPNGNDASSVLGDKKDVDNS